MAEMGAMSNEDIVIFVRDFTKDVFGSFIPGVFSDEYLLRYHLSYGAAFRV
jgi:hypothetical protein